MKKKRFYSIVLFLFCLSLASTDGRAQENAGNVKTAQRFAYRSVLDTVKQTGFYKINMTPDLMAKCNAGLSDLRISDSAGNFVAYVLKSDLPVFTTEDFQEFPILLNEKGKDSLTTVVIANGSADPINALLLVMGNMNAKRTATLSGSDDREKWFVIREHIELQEAGSDTADHYVQAISFPASKYRFFKLILDDKGLLEVNILKAGITSRSFTNGKYLGVPFPALIQKDSSDRHSYITLQYRDHYRIDKLELVLQGPVLFKRHMEVYDIGNAGNRLVGETELNPSANSLPVSAVKTDSLLLDITNGDNKPLVVQAVRTAQLSQYLFAYLEAGSGYSLVMGNTEATAPDYDLKYFVDSLSRHPQALSAGPVQPIPRDEPVRQGGNGHSGLLLWIILGALLVLLVSLSFKMMKSIPQEKKDDRL